MKPSDVSWTPLGPAPMTAGDQELDGVNDTPVSGRVTAIGLSRDFNGAHTPAMYIETAAGGIWRSTDFTTPRPTWIPLTDHLPLLDESRLPSKVPLPAAFKVGVNTVRFVAVDPNHPRSIYACSMAGILTSVDGGDHWKLRRRSVCNGHPVDLR